MPPVTVTSGSFVRRVAAEELVAAVDELGAAVEVGEVGAMP